MVIDPDPWHLDKRVPVALILALIGQTFAAGWWISAVSSDVERLQINDGRQDAMIDRIMSDSNEQAVQLGRIEEITLGTSRAVADLVRKIEAGK